MSVSGIITFYQTSKNKILNLRKNELAAITFLKTEEIIKWRNEHIRDGHIISSMVPRNKIIFNYMEDEQSFRSELLKRMDLFTKNYDYYGFLLFDSLGSLRLVHPSIDSIPMIPIPSIKTKEIILSDLHFSPDLPGIIHLDVHVPLFTLSNTWLGTMILRVDPRISLFPIIESWPNSYASSEIMLIRLEGDSIVFLSNLRHQDNLTKRLKINIDDSLIPNELILLEKEGAFEYIDYSNVKVLAYIKNIPNSPWFLISQIDKKEILRQIKSEIILISMIVLLFFLMVSLTIFYILRNQRIRFYRELNSVKDKFISIISHDLKSPFTSIKGFTGLLKEDLKQDNYNNVVRYTNIIDESSQKAVDLLSNLMDWSRLQTNRIIINYKNLQLLTVVDEVLSLVKTQALQKSIEIVKCLPAKITINSDKDILSTILRNLISNSIKYSISGGKIFISAVNGINNITIEIMDFGIGIDEETIDKLLNSEEAVTLRGTNEETGTGLGLILVRDFVKLLGGQLSIESQIGKYSKFMFSLPQ